MCLMDMPVPPPRTFLTDINGHLEGLGVNIRVVEDYFLNGRVALSRFQVDHESRSGYRKSVTMYTLGDIWPDEDLHRYHEFWDEVVANGLDSAVFNAEEGLVYVDRFTMFIVDKDTHITYEGTPLLEMPQQQLNP